MVAAISLPALICSYEVRHVSLSHNDICLHAGDGGRRVSTKYTNLEPYIRCSV